MGYHSNNDDETPGPIRWVMGCKAYVNGFGLVVNDLNNSATKDPQLL
jgi:hypothetical protein